MFEDQETWDDDTEIDPELWLHALLEMTSDKESKDKLVRKISGKTGLPPRTNRNNNYCDDYFYG